MVSGSLVDVPANFHEMTSADGRHGIDQTSLPSQSRIPSIVFQYSWSWLCQVVRQSPPEQQSTEASELMKLLNVSEEHAGNRDMGWCAAGAYQKLPEELLLQP